MAYYLKAFSLIMTVIFLTIGLSFGQEIQLITDESHPNFGAVEVVNLPEISSASVQVFPKEAWSQNQEGLPSMLGNYFTTDSSLIFVPRLPFVQGKMYVIRLQIQENLSPLIRKFEIPVLGKTPATSIVQVYPTSTELPANQLKMYIHFSGPMGNGNVYPHLQLYDLDGKEVENPFLEIQPPLWDKKQQRLTLWFDPGRIKRNLYPNWEFGPPLVAGNTYVLKIAKEWKDVLGQPLGKIFEKKFSVVEADRQKPDPAVWKIEAPESGTRYPLIIRFPESLDQALLENTIGIFGPTNKQIHGQIQTSEFERQWSFLPKQKWQSGVYRIRLSSRLEDLAGNNLKRLFDQALDSSKNEVKEVFALQFFIP